MSPPSEASLPKTQLVTASPLNCPRGWCQFHPSHCLGQELSRHLWFLFLWNPTSTLPGNPVGSTIKIYADSQSFLIDFWLYPAFCQAITVAKILRYHYHNVTSVSGQGTKILLQAKAIRDHSHLISSLSSLLVYLHFWHCCISPFITAWVNI